MHTEEPPVQVVAGANVTRMGTLSERLRECFRRHRLIHSIAVSALCPGPGPCLEIDPSFSRYGKRGACLASNLWTYEGEVCTRESLFRNRPIRGIRVIDWTQEPGHGKGQHTHTVLDS
jgi:hypothetical protein